MQSYLINGGKKLFGKVKISGAKNSALPLIAASLLTSENIVLHNVPHLNDVYTMKQLLEEMGKTITFEKGKMVISQMGEIIPKASYETVKTMRASITVLGPLLARYKWAEVSLPGGCSIGNRPVDLHIKAMELLGAKIELENGYIIASTKGLKGNTLYLNSSSGVTVLGSENALMAATLASGETVIDPCALEPEVGDVARLLIKMGAKITGIDTAVVTIHGVEGLIGAEHTVIPDRIEAGTFIAMVGACGGEIEIENINPEHLKFPILVAREMGVEIEIKEKSLIVKSKGKLKATDIVTMPYPEFPTDLQPQYMAMLTIAAGNCLVTENIFEDRFHHVAEFARMGAKIKLSKNTQALITGVSTLQGAPVMASDLRAGAGLVIAALAAEGESKVENIYHIDRGYEEFEKKVRELGGDINRV